MFVVFCYPFFGDTLKPSISQGSRSGDLLDTIRADQSSGVLLHGYHIFPWFIWNVRLLKKFFFNFY